MAASNSGGSAQNSGATAKPSLQQVNMMARQAILAQAVNMVQNVATVSVAGTVTSSNNVLNINPRMVGLLKRFFVEITGTITDTGSTAASIALTNFGPANLLSNVTMTDLSNNVRINTTGLHLHLLSSAKRGQPYGSTLINGTGIVSPTKFGNNVGQGATVGFQTAPATIPKTTGNTAVVTWIYEVPVVYSDTDLRGGIYLGTTGQTMNLQLTINPQSVIASGDPLGAIYTGDTGTLSNVTVNVYQHYLDQIPFGKNGPVLPVMDLSVLYMLNATNNTGVVSGQDFQIPYANFRDFLSTIAIIDNGGSFYGGTDVNYFALTAANFTNFYKIDPLIQTLWTRSRMQVDFPPGTYYFDHRHKPISTNQYGNMELVFNLGNGTQALASGSFVNTYYEMFALVNLIGQAGSLSIS